MGHESQIELWSPNLTTFCFAGFGTAGLRREEVMKTAGRENPYHGVAWPRNRAHGAVGQNRSRSIKWAEKQETFRADGVVFFLDFYLYRTYQALKEKEEPRSWNDNGFLRMQSLSLPRGNGNFVRPRLQRGPLKKNETKLLNAINDSSFGFGCFEIFQENASVIVGEFSQIPPISKEALCATKSVVRNKRDTKCDLS